jgi:hypothetical protein
MRVTVFFYKSIALDSILFRSLKTLKQRYPQSFWIGGYSGFGVENLSWHDAVKLSALIPATVLKTDSWSVFDEMRVVMQRDIPSSIPAE